MHDIKQNLADVNYMIFCNALQFVLLLVFASIRKFTRSSLPHMLALLQLQAHAVLFAGYVLWALMATYVGPVEAAGGKETVGAGEDTTHAGDIQTAQVHTASAMPSPPDETGVVEGVAVKSVAAKGGVKGRVKGRVKRGASDMDDEAHVAEDNDRIAAGGQYLEDVGQCLRDAGVHVAGLFMVLALGAFMLCVAASVACATAPEDRMCVITWESDDGLWVGIAYTIVQASVAVTSIMMYVRKNANRTAAPPGLVAHNLLLYSLFVWATQYILDRYNRIYSAELCTDEYKGSHELRVYTIIYLGLGGTIILLIGFCYNHTLARRMRVASTQFVVSWRVVLPLTFVFCAATIALMCKLHIDTYDLDTIVVTYMCVLFFLCVAFVRVWLCG